MSAKPQLAPELVQFICDHKSIHLAAAADLHQPTLVRGLGCRSHSADPNGVTVLVCAPQAGPLLAAIEANGRLAAVFNEPESHRTLQVKAIDARVEPANPDDPALVAEYLKRMSERLEIYGVTAGYVHTLCHCPDDALVRVSFTPLLAFQQTPGGLAGSRLPLDGSLNP